MSTLLTRQEIKGAIEPHLFSQLRNESYKKEIIDPLELLMENRFELAFKLLFLDMLDKKIIFGNQYLAHIHALTSGTFTEFGNDQKNIKNNLLNIRIPVWEV